MFGISLTEMVMIALVALVFVGPKKLPQMMRTVGEWVGKARSLTTQVRQQTGIDEILRQEGIDGGLSELRGLLRGDLGGGARHRPSSSTSRADDPYQESIEYDRSREYPLEGADAYGALPDDLVFDFGENDAPPESAEPTDTSEPSSPPRASQEGSA
ncbi:MAG: Sec-independent protein translocase protein TatB [Polyangiaceae bacterium]|nr:Sec-independent protein translocase protein TatB [Polyangiaceae bacterium]MCW5791113.1 Sec-independent protein translocase protein TatB [Polyangiaceae bacterium]